MLIKLCDLDIAYVSLEGTIVTEHTEEYQFDSRYPYLMRTHIDTFVRRQLLIPEKDKKMPYSHVYIDDLGNKRLKRVYARRKIPAVYTYTFKRIVKEVYITDIGKFLEANCKYSFNIWYNESVDKILISKNDD